ncbi:MAG: tRNA (adenosine(37)-N6)-threonylcarbamoyltransferase complex dimerization subunit type 1 TsaB [Spirochaetaceae bacterium]|nr:tRNA (adenosine(37)-N6)-threonylcarbamoyltransferase complex dimerization subunit type 1 TsaB [Spirochaetaceae bacterium]
MNIIAFDTASDTFALGLAVETGKPDEEKRYYLEISGGGRHSELIMDGADTLLRMAGLKKEELGGAACMEGPGSFTGLRIGFAAAKGIALALGIPLIAIPTLDCMAESLSFWPGIVLPVMDAKKNAFFTALYRRGERIGDFADIDAQNLALLVKKAAPSPSLLITGPAAPLVFPELAAVFPQTASDPAYQRAHPGELLNLAIKKCILVEGKLLDSEKEPHSPDSGPLYLRKSDAELHKQNG